MSQAGIFGDGVFTSQAGKSMIHATEKVANEGARLPVRGE